MGCRDIHDATQIGMLMGYCDHQMHRLMTRMLRQYDVSPMQCRTLTFLQEAEGEVNQRMLEEHLMVKPSTASGIVGRLEKKVFILCPPEFRQGFSPEERDTLRRLLLRIADNLSETQEDTE